MSRSDRELSEADIALFREAVGEVRRLRNDRIEPERPRPTPQPRQRQADERAVVEQLLHSDPEALQVETGEELLYLRPGLQKNVLRKLRRGHYRVEADLDLHGVRAAKARGILAAFLADSRARGRHCVRIVHGKGVRSADGEAVLKPLLNTWLRRRDEVLAFSSARPADGGTGAVYVLLRKRRS